MSETPTKDGVRAILHSDLNCFYASVETVLNPALRGKAMAVCGSVEERHGIVLAKTEEAKRAGIQTGMTVYQAKKLCPTLITVPPHFEVYAHFSALTQNIYARYTDLVEPFGLDECWLDVTGSRLLFGEPREIAESIRRTVKEELGLTVSIGVSFNKVFAKLGSDMKKPDAITEIPPDSFRERVWGLPVTDLLYVGKSCGDKLSKLGIHTIGEAAEMPRSFFARHFGVNGVRLWQYANGLDDSPVARIGEREPVKSVGHGTTTRRDLVTEEEVRSTILQLCGDVDNRLRKHGLLAGGVALSLRDENFFTRRFQKRLTTPTASRRELADAAFSLYRQEYFPRRPIRSVTVTAIFLCPHGTAAQADLFVDYARLEKRETVDRVAADINNRYGADTLFVAAGGGERKG